MRKSGRFFVLMMVCAALLIAFPSAKCGAKSTVFYVVRHAERASEVGTDRLTLLGMHRAVELSWVLRSVPLSGIYSSITRRTWQTATPTALASGVEITPYGRCEWNQWAAALKENHAGKSVLIVGHSDTLQDIIRALGGQGEFPIHGNEDLYVVKVDDGVVKVENRRYSVRDSVVKPLGPVDFKGDIHESEDISGISGTKDLKFLVIGSDETSEVQVLKKMTDHYEVQDAISLGCDKEIDIEGITRHGDTNTFFVVGSHSWRRKNIMRKKHRKKTYQKIKKRFEVDSPDREKSRERLIQFELSAETGKLVPGSMKEVSLRDTLDKHPVLGHFSKIPGKENGIDIEGIASDGVNLYLGFRGPVFRHGFAPVLVFPPNAPDQAELRYVALDGCGIRDMARVEGGFLLIAGPVGEASLPCKIYFWDGGDCLPGKRSEGEPARGSAELLGTIPAPTSMNAEGILVLSEEKGRKSYEFMIVVDGPKGGSPTRFRAVRP